MIRGFKQKREAAAKESASFISQVLGLRYEELEPEQQERVRGLEYHCVLFRGRNKDKRIELRKDMENAWREGLEA